jgi:hypothetical protein
LKLLKEIAAEHNVDWDPADTEAELMKQPEDLLVSLSFSLSCICYQLNFILVAIRNPSTYLHSALIDA